MMKVLSLIVATALAGLAVLALYHKGLGSATTASFSDPALTGTIEAREIEVAPEVSARIVAIGVEEGQTVKKGDVIATLDDELFQLRVARLQAALTTARADIASLRAPSRWATIREQQSKIDEAQLAVQENEAALERATGLSEKGAGAQIDVVNAQYAARAAEHRLETAKSGLQVLQTGARQADIDAAEARAAEQEREVELAQLDVKRTKILAPADGVVLRRHYEVGEMVTPGTPIITLLNTQSMWVELAADERMQGSIELGQEADLRPEAMPSQHFKGHVSFVADRHSFTPKTAQTHEDRAMLTFRVKVKIDEPPPYLKPGMFVDVWVLPDGAPSGPKR